MKKMMMVLALSLLGGSAFAHDVGQEATWLCTGTGQTEGIQIQIESDFDGHLTLKTKFKEEKTFVGYYGFEAQAAKLVSESSRQMVMKIEIRDYRNFNETLTMGFHGEGLDIEGTMDDEDGDGEMYYRAHYDCIKTY